MLELLISGAIQGIFEWLPVSSQGIISLFLANSGYTLENATDLAFFLHAGTLLATIVYFWKDIKHLLLPKSEKGLRDLKFLVWVTVGSVITGLPAYLLLQTLSGIFSNSSVIIGALLIITGLLQYLQKNFGYKTGSAISWLDGLYTGIFQGFSALPGISRSGTTTLVLLARGFASSEALKYSFLASIPVIAGLQVVEVFKGLYFKPEYLLALLTAFIVGTLSIGLFLKIARKVKFSLFCIVLGLITIFL